MGGMSGVAGRTHGSHIKRHPNMGVSCCRGVVGMFCVK